MQPGGSKTKALGYGLEHEAWIRSSKLSIITHCYYYIMKPKAWQTNNAWQRKTRI